MHDGIAPDQGSPESRITGWETKSSHSGSSRRAQKSVVFTNELTGRNASPVNKGMCPHLLRPSILWTTLQVLKAKRLQMGRHCDATVPGLWTLGCASLSVDQRGCAPRMLKCRRLYTTRRNAPNVFNPRPAPFALTARHLGAQRKMRIN